MTLKKESFILIYKTVFDSKENKTKEIRNGQKDLCTAKNGLEKAFKFII